MTICPICQKRRSEMYQPFCSKRCADVDLGHWLKEGYRIPAEEEPDDDDHEPDYSRLN